MDFNKLEMRRETVFKDAVLSAAETKSMEIIGGAQRTAAQQLAEAQASCEEADHDAIRAALAPDGEREHSSALQQARLALLQHREELVEGLFADVEKQLAQFAAGPDYGPWIIEKVKNMAKNAQKTEKVIVYVRKEDSLLENDLKAAAGPTAEVAGDETIRLGGAKVQYGRVLYDCTLDDALRQEREHFGETSGMTL